MASAPAIVPIYTTSVPNEEVTLFVGRLTLITGPKKLHGNGRIFLAWTPSPIIRFDARVRGVLGGEQFIVAFASSRRRASAKAYATHVQIGNDRRGLASDVEGFFGEPVSVGAGQDIARVVFHVPNFPLPLGPLSTTADGWRIELNSAGLARIPSELGAGGFLLTAVGQLSRDDGSTFSGASAFDALYLVGDFLSFSAGAWSDPGLLVGFDTAGALIWRRWSAPRASSWKNYLHWWPTGGDQAALDLLDPWMRRRGDPYWQEVLGRTVYMMVNGNEGRADVGLLLAQAALETLAWAVVVVDRATVAANTFDSKAYNAATRIAKLLAELGLPTTVPPDLSALGVFAPSSSHTDGPSKITWVRNRLAHPVKSAAGRPPLPVTIESWLLAEWYLEIAVLSLLGYRGPMWSRIVQRDGSFP